MNEPVQGGSERASRIVSRLATTLWLWAIPALLAVLAVRHLFPTAGDPFEPVSDPSLAKLTGEYAAGFWAAFFLLFALLARYWGRYVPGAEPVDSENGRAHSARRATSFVLVVALAAGGALLFRTSVFQSYRVQSSSMLPGFAPGALLAVDRLAYGFKVPGLERRATKLPQRGDVVVFQSPEATASDDAELVKRVVGLPGDRVALFGGRTVINGWGVPACFAGHYPLVGAGGATIARLHLEFLEDRTYAVFYPMRPTPEPMVEVLVKPGEIFVLGDNRAGSADSRSWNRGRGAGLPISSISGRVRRVLVGSNRNGRLDASRILEPLGLELNLHRVESAKLEEYLQNCLKLRPKDTRPPPASHGAVSQ